MKAGFFGEFFSFDFVIVMDITQTRSPTAPIQEIVARIHFRLRNCRNIPGLDSGFELFTVQELLVGVDEKAIGFE